MLQDSNQLSFFSNQIPYHVLYDITTSHVINEYILLDPSFSPNAQLSLQYIFCPFTNQNMF